MSAAKPRCFLCETAIEPAEPFKLVQAYTYAAGAAPRLPGKTGGRAEASVRIVQRAVHYCCELEAVAAAGVAGASEDAPGIIVDDEDEDLTTREKLSRLMGRALDALDFFDELLPG